MKSMSTRMENDFPVIMYVHAHGGMEYFTNVMGRGLEHDEKIVLIGS